MTDLPDRPVQRLRRPGWRDTRLVSGVLLVLVSTVLGSLVVARADDRVPVYVASGPLVPGDPLRPEVLERRDVQLDDALPGYLLADRALPPDAFLAREVRAGELIPLSALVGRADVGVQQVTLLVDALSARALVRGSVVDVYASTRVRGGATDELGPPRLLLQRASVATRPEEASGFGASADRVSVRVLVPTGQVREVVGALDAGARVTVVPVPGSVVSGTS